MRHILAVLALLCPLASTALGESLIGVDTKFSSAVGGFSTAMARTSMVCCRTRAGNMSCTPFNTSWTTRQNCDRVGFAGTDGKNICPNSKCGH
jgi:hypothetical protein